MLVHTRTNVSFASAAFIAIAACAAPAHAITFTLTPVTNTTPFFAGTIKISGTITLDPGERFVFPVTGGASYYLPYKLTQNAHFEAADPAWDPDFSAWIGSGTYTGPILNLKAPSAVLLNDGMPEGLYWTNPTAASNMSSITLTYLGADSLPRVASADYAVNVVPTPSAAAAFIAAATLAGSRRRRR